MQFAILFTVICFFTVKATCYDELSKNLDIRTLQQYIRIDTTIGKNLDPAVMYWSQLARSARAKFTVYEYVKNYPVIVMKWESRNSSQNSIVLTTNMDVVAANVKDGWTYPPFSAYVDEDGDMYGRGTQEYKSVSVQHYEALGRMRNEKIPLHRNFYMVLTPDKETGSTNGLAPFLESKEFADMNAGFFLIGGVATPDNEIGVLYRGKTRWYFRVECNGLSGSSTKLFNPSSIADGPCGKFYEEYAKYRTEQYKLSQKCSDQAFITSINFVGPDIKQEIGSIPKSMFLYFDAYLAINMKFYDFEAMVKQWVAKAGKNIQLESLLVQKSCDQDKIENNPYYAALQNASKILNITFSLRTSTGPEEGSIIARAGYPVFGISPLPNTEDLKAAVNERINIQTYLKGIKIFEEIFKQLNKIPGDEISDDPSDYLVTY